MILIFFKTFFWHINFKLITAIRKNIILQCWWSRCFNIYPS